MQRSVRAALMLVVVASLVAVTGGPIAGATSEVRLRPIVSGFSRPVVIAHAPGEGRTMYVAEQTGAIERVAFVNGDWQRDGSFLDLTNRVIDPNVGGNEQGLLGLAFHPDYATNGRFYVNYTRRGSDSARGDTVIAEYRRGSGGRADPDSHRTVMVIQQPFENHNGGHLAFGPDGYLYIATGDGGGSGDPRGNAQRRSTLLGKILRIDPLDPDGSGPRRYRVPRSNPLVGRSGRDEIWAWGLRNPWRFSFDRANGDLWIGDVGQFEWEEVDRSKANRNERNAGKGNNYGWDRCEGRRRYPNTNLRCQFGTRPVHAYRHGSGRCSVTGGYVHRGPAAPAWRGLYVAADFCGRLFVLGPKGGTRLSRNSGLRISTFGEDPAGRLFAAHLGGTIYQVRFVGPRPR
jgi:glucose/arabinose dehydrogenase